MKFVLIGAPLSGKGTISKMLSKHFQIPHISMGDLLRNCAKGDNKYSKYIATNMENGKLVNDDLVKIILQDRLSKEDCKNGYILDGYPRNISQANNLDDITKIDKAIYCTVSEVTLIQRLSTRFICPKCYKSYNIESYCKKYCEDCNEPLTKRADDTEDILLRRVKLYNETAFPILDKYLKENKLVTIANEGDINLVFEELLGKIK